MHLFSPWSIATVSLGIRLRHLLLDRCLPFNKLLLTVVVGGPRWCEIGRRDDASFSFGLAFRPKQAMAP